MTLTPNNHNDCAFNLIACAHNHCIEKLICPDYHSKSGILLRIGEKLTIKVKLVLKNSFNTDINPNSILFSPYLFSICIGNN